MVSCFLVLTATVAATLSASEYLHQPDERLFWYGGSSISTTWAPKQMQKNRTKLRDVFRLFMFNFLNRYFTVRTPELSGQRRRVALNSRLDPVLVQCGVITLKSLKVRSGDPVPQGLSQVKIVVWAHRAIFFI